MTDKSMIEAWRTAMGAAEALAESYEQAAAQYRPDALARKLLMCDSHKAGVEAEHAGDRVADPPQRQPAAGDLASLTQSRWA